MEDEDELIEKEIQDASKSGIRSFLAFIFILIDLATVSGCLVVLIITKRDCDEPLRLWITILAGFMGFHCLFLLTTEILAVSFRHKPGIGSVYFAINTLIHSFLFLWMLVGVVWTYNDSSQCKEEYYEGWLLATLIFGIYFGVFAIVAVMLFFITCVTCVGAWHISAYMNKDS